MLGFVAVSRASGVTVTREHEPVRATVGPSDFREFFTSCWGEDKPPFAWQTKLTRRVMSDATRAHRPESVHGESNTSPPRTGAWPEAIVLPTAAGKTACIDIAVFALAAQADRMDGGAGISAPRRIFFVVDRRVIVDEALQRATLLAQKLALAREGVLKRIADNLRRIARGDQGSSRLRGPLAVHALRGGMYRSEAWARNPLQPTVVASTVDQVGSRLLFRAYGRGPGTWPVYAGLVACDSLVLLDEVHCAQPFFQTLRAVSRFCGEEWAEAPLGRCFHPVVMSATPPPGLRDVFEDESDERANLSHPLGKRQLAHKPARLQTVTKAKGSKRGSVFPQALAEAALRILGEDRKAIVVFVNRVSTARETYKRLAGRGDLAAILLTGRMRPVDKDRVLEQLRALQLGSNDSADRELDCPVIVVATQTLEVGADLDFDGMVTECASLDALRQRFGRLNRLGRDVDACATIMIREDQVKLRSGKKDPVYGSALVETWRWLRERTDDDDRVDFGIAYMDRLVANSDSDRLRAPSLNAPVMLPAHIDCWAQTFPAPSPTPDVAVFLHGPRETKPDALVCWRADLDLTTQENWKYALESLTLCPPSSGETLSVPVGFFRSWLAGINSIDDTADVEGMPIDDESHEDSSTPTRRVVRWRGAKTSVDDITSDPARIRPGDVVVVPTTHLGGWASLGDIPPEAAPTAVALDVGDAAHRVSRAKPILRLHPKLVGEWPDSMPAKTAALDLLRDVEQRFEQNPDRQAHEVHDLLHQIAYAGQEIPERWSWLREAADELRAEFTISRLRQESLVLGGKAVVLAGKRRIKKLVHAADNFSDEDDVSASGMSRSSGRPVRLVGHLQGVEHFARLHATNAGLPKSLVEAIGLAGLIHDVGKADPRFQSLLRGGRPWYMGVPLAKSGNIPSTPWALRKAREAVGYPAGRPHPMLSVRLAESAPDLLPDSNDMRDLVLHLVGSHHGQCRPFAPIVVDNDPVEATFSLKGATMRSRTDTELERLDSGVSDRYWRLTRRYGWWGLAWLEALLRLADWRQSESEQAING